MSRTAAKAKDWQSKVKAKDMVNWPRGSSRPVDHVLEDSISAVCIGCLCPAYISKFFTSTPDLRKTNQWACVTI